MYTLNGLSKLGYPSIGGLINLSFSDWKALSHSSVQTKGASFCSSLCRGLAMLELPLMNCSSSYIDQEGS